MPNFDKTGPAGKCPKTGKGKGGCSAEDLKKLKDMGFVSKDKNPSGKCIKDSGRGYGSQKK